MAGQQNPGMGQPSPSDTFSQSLVNKLWPSTGFAGAAQSPYLNIVSPLFQSIDPSINALTASMQSQANPTISAPPSSASGQEGKGGSSMGALMKGIDPVMSSTLGK